MTSSNDVTLKGAKGARAFVRFYVKNKYLTTQSTLKIYKAMVEEMTNQQVRQQ